MRIAYVCHANIGLEDGVSKKIRAQIAIWRDSGYDARLFWLARRGSNDGSDEESDAPGVAFRYEPGGLGRPHATRALIRAVREYAPDIIYLRYHIFIPTLRSLLAGIPTVVEINTDDKSEFPLQHRLLGLYNRMNRRVTLSRAEGLVTVTNELAQSERFSSFGKETVVIANGIAADDFGPLVPIPSVPPRIAFLGTGGVWQGFDKVIRLASWMPEWQFDLIGISQSEVSSLVPPNVVLHGHLKRARYEPILARADVALGTLALHRNQMDEASPLKLREYLLAGLPTVIGYRDTDFLDESPWFILQLPNVETNVDDNVDAIRAYAERVRGSRVARSLVLNRIDARVKERQRLSFLEEILEKTRRRRTPVLVGV